MAVSKKIRFEVFKRDGFVCQYCGRKPPEAVLECDHVLPVSKGGTDDELNLLTSCFDCNRGKSDRSLDAAPPQISDEVSKRIECVEQMRAFNEYMMEIRERETEIIEAIAAEWIAMCPPPIKKGKRVVFSFDFPRDRMASLRAFIKRLPIAEVRDAMEIAHSRKPVTVVHSNDGETWKYFCGVCWSKIKKAANS